MYGLDLKSYADAVKVFDEIGLIEEAEVLRDYDNDISEENADICYERLAINNDYDAFLDKVYVYADKNTYNKYLEDMHKSIFWNKSLLYKQLLQIMVQ